MKERIKVTTATLRNDNPELHERKSRNCCYGG